MDDLRLQHGVFHGDPHRVPPGGEDRLVHRPAGKRRWAADTTKLTRLLIDAASENVEMIPKRLSDLGVRYDKSREEEFVADIRELYDRYYGARLAEYGLRS